MIMPGSVVGAPRFELGTSCAQGRRATRLRYAPMSTSLPREFACAFFGGFRFLGLSGFLAADNRGDDEDALLAFLHEAPELVPSVKACHVRSSRLLHRNQHDVAQAVAVEFGHGSEVGSQSFAATFVERPDRSRLNGPAAAG